MDECICVACGTQCEICMERYPYDCTCVPEDAICDDCWATTEEDCECEN